jgi:molecular chaperone GrpE
MAEHGMPNSGQAEVADARDTGEGAEAREAPEVAELRVRVADLEDRWKRALADFDNLRKRVAGESTRQRADERARVAAQWLPVVDNLDLALEHAGSDESPVVAGVRAVRDQALELLAQLGFPRLTDVGELFDPSQHEVVAVLPVSDAKPGTIVQVVRPGYRDLRPAAVVVVKGD